uniref:Uncharacterized protein n=1 Tax=Ditylenchus dipsaci TaxID=166011 RepID=A0A915CQG7_9BILA
MDTHIEDYKNPFYQIGTTPLIDVDIRASAFVVWTSMYNRFDNGIQPREYFADVALTTTLHINYLEEMLKAKNKQQITLKWH